MSKLLWPLQVVNLKIPGLIWRGKAYFVQTGAIIRDGDRKSWDARGPMIWDNFSIFRTNCVILTSYIRADPRTCRGLSRGCCHVMWWNGELRDSALADFPQRWQEPELFYVLLCSDLMEKVCFSGSIISLISCCEWIKSARRLVMCVNFCVCSVEKSFVRKLFTPVSSEWVCQNMINHNQNLFW